MAAGCHPTHVCRKEKDDAHTQSYERGGTNRGSNRKILACVWIIELYIIILYNIVALCYTSNLNDAY